MFILLIVVVLLVLWAVLAYNRFVRLTNQAKEAWSDIDVQLKRRYDLIPNLVNTVKGYATHENSVFANVTNARAASLSAGTPGAKAQAENVLAGALKSVFAVAEAYPDLKANQNFLSLQGELSDTEDKIQAARRFYNGTVRDLNTSIESFPNSVIANAGHFAKMDLFELADADAAARNPVEVKF
ncbi:MAG: LemA family protein [Candidatus Pacebacteria bacterium]|nr:LemA family protein [Candidatus Paceibacterota bacterium]